MKRLFSCLIVFAVFLLTAQELVIFSTGDLHGSFAGKHRFITSLDAVLTKLKSQHKTAPVLIDAGDICKGWGSAEAFLSDGKLAFEFLSQLKYDIFVPGNHELEMGEDFFRSMSKPFAGKILAANIPSCGFDGSCIIERDNIKIGVIGIAHGGIGMVKRRIPDKKVKLIPETDAIAAELGKLKKAGATVFILVRHYGIHTADEKLLGKFPEISLVINAHSHVDKIKRVNNTLCVQAFAPETVVSTLKIKDGKVVESKAEYIKLDPQAKISPDTQKFCEEKIAPLTAAAKKDFPNISKAKSREELLFEVMKKNMPADIYLIRKRSRSNAHYKMPMNERALSYIYSYWSKLCSIQMTSEQLNKTTQELKKTGTLILDNSGAPADLSGKSSWRITGSDQVFFDIRMKNFISAVSKNNKELAISEKTFYALIREYLADKSVPPAPVTKAQAAKKPAQDSQKKIRGDFAVKSLKFTFDNKEYSGKFSLKKKGTYKVKCELVFNIDDPEKIVFWNFKKPLMMTKWFLNGQRIDRNGDDMLSSDITGIDGALLKKGLNTLVCDADIWVGKMPLGHGKAPKASYSAKSFSFEKTSPQKAEFIKGPVAGYGLTDKLSFSAFTNLPCKVELDFNGRKMVSNEGFFHQFEVDKLVPDTRYNYTMTLDCRGVKKSTERFSIKTLPAKGKIRFAVLGDSQGNPEAWRRIMSKAAEFKPDFLLHVGDLTSEGNQFDYWNRWDFDGVRQYQAQFPRFLATGNHERQASIVTKLICMANGKLSQIYQVRDDLKVITLGFGAYGKPVKRYCADLDKSLKKAKDKYIFFAGHGPAWSSGKHGNFKHSAHVIKVLEKHKVQAFFSGHDHSYSRSEPGKGTTQIVAASTSSMPYKPLKAHLNPHQKVFHSKMNFVIVDCLEDKAVFTAYGFDLDKDKLPVNMHVIDSGSWNIRTVKENKK